MSIDGIKTKNLWNGTIDSQEKAKRLKIRNIAGDEIVNLIVWS